MKIYAGMTQPQLIHADHLADSWPMAGLPHGEWVAARPLSAGPWWSHLILAWGVFTGRYDALKWNDQ